MISLFIPALNLRIWKAWNLMGTSLRNGLRFWRFFFLFEKKYSLRESVQIRSFFWSVFSFIWTEYGSLRSESDKRKLHIWTLFTQCTIFQRSWIFLLITFSETFFSNKLNNPTACNTYIRSSHPEGVLGKNVLKICNKFTGKHSCRNPISIKLLFSFIEIALRHVYSPVNLLHFFVTPFSKNTSGRLLLSDAKMHLF